MLASVFTANLVFSGAVDGLIVALLAMGIVLVYRSSRVINFAVGDMGVPAAALLAVMVAKSHWPYWPALIGVVLVGTLTGAVVELAVIRRLFHAPRVIVLVATIGVAELAQAVTHTLPDYRTGDLQAAFPSPITTQWTLGSITIEGAQLLTLIVVPVITVGLWWLLGHTRFGEAVSVRDERGSRAHGINPKLVSTAVWSIAGFLSAMAVILWATSQQSSQLVSIGPDTLLLGLTAALIGRMTSFPKTVLGAIAVGILYRVIPFNFSNDSGLVQFVLFILVLVLVRVRRATTRAPEASHSRSVRAVPERLKEVWWIRRMPQLLGGFRGARRGRASVGCHPVEPGISCATILAFAICAVSVTVLTGWGGQLSLGQMAFAGLGALQRRRFGPGVSVNIGWRSTRLREARICMPCRSSSPSLLGARRVPVRDRGRCACSGQGPAALQ